MKQKWCSLGKGVNECPHFMGLPTISALTVHNSGEKNYPLILEDENLPLECVFITTKHSGANCCGQALNTMARSMCKKIRGHIPVKGKYVLGLKQGA